MYVCMHVCTVCVSGHCCKCAGAYVCMYVCMYVCVYVCTVCVSGHCCKCAGAHICVYAFAYGFVCVCVRVCVFGHARTYM